jgi:UDP-N-acetylmuramoyl-L-alanyl-D-glutamate--2,6-diaminopimelate ligase
MTAVLSDLQPPPRPEPPPGPYLVVGVGRAGQAAAQALARLEGAGRVSAWDGIMSPVTEAARAKLRAQGIECELGGDGVAMLARDPSPLSIVKSPGVPPDSPLLDAAARRGLPVVDELELGWRLGSAPVIAVTGTNGKSTTASLALAALRGASVDAALAGNTEFGPPLSELDGAASCVVCEVSSFQLEGCTAFLPEAAVFTNLTRDHLHRHRTMKEYGEIKRRLFLRGGLPAPLCVVNVDSSFGRELADSVEAAGARTVRYGADRAADYRLESCDWDLRSLSARIGTPGGPLTVVTWHPGAHNAANVTAAVALADALGLDRDATRASLAASPPVPGRFEAIDHGQPFDVVVDFAHSPDALQSALGAARRIVAARPGARLLTVVSTPCTHDPPKRPEMGRIARERSDVLAITSTSSYGEPVELAVEGLLEGARGAAGATLHVEIDRRAAIELAFRHAAPGDLVLITGRGALPRLRVDPSGAGPPFDDRVVAGELLAELTERRRAADAARGSSGRVLQPR